MNIRPTEAVVDLDAIAFNIRSLKNHVGPGPRFMAVVKADAYGHGIIHVAKTAAKAGADWLGVALLEEAVALRRAGIDLPILVLGEAFSKGAELYVEYDIRATVCSLDSLLALNRAGELGGSKVRVHVKVDTGMGRIGLEPDQVLPMIERAQALRNIQIEGLFSHFASADEEDKTFSFDQLDRFKKVISTLENRGIGIPIKHFAGSAATIDIPESYFDMVRPGISIYGAYPSEEVDHSVPLKPAMTMKTAISFLKEVESGTPLSYGRTYRTQRRSRIATLPVGYGDGYPRLLSNRGEVLVAGQRAPVVGRVCMDMTLIDVTHIPGVSVGAEVVLFGKQGNAEIRVDELASKTGTISYEILCTITKRVPRQYVGAL
ncbi:MAG: alanine racemase [Deltaproteobacteria bacterium]|nr:MAG: alanine racemase [Deltaproteobacteria bacterium]